MKADTERLRYFVSRLPKETRAAFEFRDDSWYSPEILQILEDAGCALVRAVGGHDTPSEVPDAGPFRYVRVHHGEQGIGLRASMRLVKRCKFDQAFHVQIQPANS